MQKLVNLLLNWVVAYIVIPLSMWVVDYFRLRKENKDIKAKVKALEEAKTSKEKDEAIDNMH